MIATLGPDSETEPTAGQADVEHGSGRIRSLMSELESGARAERRLARTITLILSVALPIAFVAYADHVRNRTGVNAVGAAGAVVGLSLVIAMVVVARRI